MDESNGTAEIPLTNGMIALIDAEDFEKVSQYKWYFHHKAGRRGFNVGYIETTKRINGRKLPLHRLILEPKADECIDHINRNTLDNRRCNLRICTNHQNCHNRGPNPGRKFKGSILRKRKRGPDIYESQICFNWKIIFLGTFRTAEEAARAYDKKAKELFGEFACLNFPEEDAI